MNTRERIELAIARIYTTEQLHYMLRCFYCAYGCKMENGVTLHQGQEEMAYALLMMGVNYGTYVTFELTTYRGMSYVCSNGGCCVTTYEVPDPNWQRFIDEVVSIVDNQGS